MPTLPPPPPPNLPVAGLVVSERDGHPIPHATVVLADVNTREAVASAITDDAGHYELPPAPAGKYTLSAAARGYITSAYLHHDDFSTAIVTGAGLPTDHLNLTLCPGASLLGTLADDAEPIERAQVELLREDLSGSERIASFRSTAVLNGRFEFLDLPPGRYYLRASGKPWYAMVPHSGRQANPPYRTAIDPTLQRLYPDTFYPDTTDSAAAQPLAVHPGEQLTVALQMHPQRPVTLTIHLPAAPPAPKSRERPAPDEQAEGLEGAEVVGVVRLSHTVFGKEQTSETGYADEDGTITLNVLPGRYFLSQSSREQGPDSRVGEVDLSGTATTMSLPALSGMGTATVNVRGLPPKQEDAPATRLALLREGEAGDAGTQSLDDKNQTTLRDLPAANYRFHVYPAGQFSQSLAEYPEVHIDTVTVNGRPAPDKQLHLAAGAKANVTLTVVQKRVTLQGVALHDGKPAPAAMVVLVPAGADTNESLYRRDQADLDGSFTLQNVEPGRYIVVAIMDGWPLRWNDAAALAPYLVHGLAVTVANTAPAQMQLPAPVGTIPR